MRKHRLYRTGLALAAVGLVTASATVLAGPASASHGQQASTGVLDTTEWRVCLSGTSDLRIAVDHAMAQINPTDVNASYEDCHSGLVNVSVFEVDSPESFFGLTTCLAGRPGNLCDSKSLQFNTRRLNTVLQWLKTACHEFGHVAGLDHSRTDDSSCMKQGVAPPIAATFDDHDIEEINETY